MFPELLEACFHMAHDSARLATCSRRNVGAVLVVEGRIRAVGWNGMERAREAPTCQQGACPRGRQRPDELPHGSEPYTDCIYTHAEMNALRDYRHAQGIRHNADWARGVCVVVSTEPCGECQKYASWAGAQFIWEDK